MPPTNYKYQKVKLLLTLSLEDKQGYTSNPSKKNLLKTSLLRRSLMPLTFQESNLNIRHQYPTRSAACPIIVHIFEPPQVVWLWLSFKKTGIRYEGMCWLCSRNFPLMGNLRLVLLLLLLDLFQRKLMQRIPGITSQLVGLVWLAIFINYSLRCYLVDREVY